MIRDPPPRPSSLSLPSRKPRSMGFEFVAVVLGKCLFFTSCTGNRNVMFLLKASKLNPSRRPPPHTVGAFLLCRPLGPVLLGGLAFLLAIPLVEIATGIPREQMLSMIISGGK